MDVITLSGAEVWFSMPLKMYMCMYSFGIFYFFYCSLWLNILFTALLGKIHWLVKWNSEISIHINFLWRKGTNAEISTEFDYQYCDEYWFYITKDDRQRVRWINFRFLVFIADYEIFIRILSTQKIWYLSLPFSVLPIFTRLILLTHTLSLEWEFRSLPSIAVPFIFVLYSQYHA